MKTSINKVIHYRYWIGVGASVLLGLIFGISGLGKLAEPIEVSMTIFILPKVLLPPTLAEIIALWLPRVELVLGLLLIIGIATKFMASFCYVLIAAFILNNSWMIGQGLEYDSCGCFGVFEKVLGQLSPIGALYLDIGMIALALIVSFCYPGSFLTIRPWFLGREPSP